MRVVRRTLDRASLALALVLLALGFYGVAWGDFTSGAFLLALGALLVVYGLAALERRLLTAAHGVVFLLVGAAGLAQGVFEVDNDLPLAALDLGFGLGAIGLGVHVLRARPAT